MSRGREIVAFHLSALVELLSAMLLAPVHLLLPHRAWGYEHSTEAQLRVFFQAGLQALGTVFSLNILIATRAVVAKMGRWHIFLQCQRRARYKVPQKPSVLSPASEVLHMSLVPEPKGPGKGNTWRDFEQIQVVQPVCLLCIELVARREALT